MNTGAEAQETASIFAPKGPPPPAPAPVPDGDMNIVASYTLFRFGAQLVAALVVAGQLLTGWSYFDDFPADLKLIFIGLSLTVSVPLLLYAWTGRRNRTRTYTHGQPAVATVVKARRSLLRQQFGRPWLGSPSSRVTWTFGVDGRKYSGKRTSPNSDLEELRRGHRIWVLYDPDNPKRNVEWPPM